MQKRYLIINAQSGRQILRQHEVTMPRGNCSVDKAPDSHWTKEKKL